jgi:hypothetical protein
MKKLVFLMLMAAAAMAFAGCGVLKELYEVYETDDVPPYATSKRVLRFHKFLWSDYIAMPDCNKSDFSGNEKPDCRSDTFNGKTYYYYNWYYKERYKKTMCPNGWQLPTKTDAVVYSDYRMYEKRYIINMNTENATAFWGLPGTIGLDVGQWGFAWVNSSDRIKYMRWSPSSPEVEFVSYKPHIHLGRTAMGVVCVKRL